MAGISTDCLIFLHHPKYNSDLPEQTAQLYLMDSSDSACWIVLWMRTGGEHVGQGNPLAFKFRNI